MSDVQPLRKQEEDFTERVDAALPEADKLANAGQLQEALDRLLALEKQTRNAADLSSTSRILLHIVDTLYARKELALMNTHLSLLSRRHGQLRQAIQKMVEQAMTYLDGLQGETKLALIDTLREVTEGKIYLEVQRARVTRMLSKIKEDGGDTAAASDLLQDLQVETFGSMERREKTDFILEQMRLLRTQKDWDRFAITSKKINTKWLGDKDNEDLKLRFYHLMIVYSLQADKYLDLCKYFRSVYDTPSIQDSEPLWTSALRNAVFFIVLAPHDNEQSDLIERISQDERLPNLPDCSSLVKCFTTPELMRWPGIEELYGPHLRQTRVFGAKGVTGTDHDIDEDPSEGKGETRWQDLHKRVVEHNIRTISKYYTRITLERLSQLLDLSRTEAEDVLCGLVVKRTIYARIDRPAGTVLFQEPRSTDKVLNEWSSDVSKLMGLVEKTCHLISKEHAVHQARIHAQQAAA